MLCIYPLGRVLTTVGIVKIVYGSIFLFLQANRGFATDKVSFLSHYISVT
jgi:hypothetical protein